MENKKTPEQWFVQLKEPYRSEAIANIQSELIKNYFESIIEALYSSFIWTDTPQNYKYWIDIFNSIEAGETTYLEPENVSLINEVNNSQVTEQQNQIEPEKVNWEKKYNELDAKFDALADSHSRLEFYDQELEMVVDEQSKLIKRLQNELQEKESKEKVYFYFSEQMDYFCHNKDLEAALNLSCNDMEIYQAICIGKKKSVLVSE